MPSAARRSARGLAALLALLGACESTPVPPAAPHPIDLILDFCADATPVWFAYQNEREPWRVVAPDAQGTVRFTAFDRVAIAYVLEQGSDYTTELIGAHNTELDELSSMACLDATGSKRLNGTVSGVGSSQLGLVTMFYSSVYLPPTQTSFTLTQLADRPLDLVASRVTVSGSTRQASDRVIIRRNQNLVNNATVAELNFDLADPVATHAVTVQGIASGEAAFLYQNFFSQLGTSHPLYYFDLPADGAFSVPAVPSGLTAAGDYHDLFVLAYAADFQSFRGAERFGRTGAAATLALGAGLPDLPVFEPVSTQPYVRLLGSMPTGIYRSAVVFELRQPIGASAATMVNVTLTESFAEGARATPWRFELPDFSQLSGWQNAWGLRAGDPIFWVVTGFLGRPALIFGAPPREGETITFAGHSSGPASPAAPAVAGTGIAGSLRTTAVPRRFPGRRP